MTLFLTGGFNSLEYRKVQRPTTLLRTQTQTQTRRQVSQFLNLTKLVTCLVAGNEPDVEKLPQC